VKGFQLGMFGVNGVSIDPSIRRADPPSAAQLAVARLVESLPIGTRLAPTETEVQISVADPGVSYAAAVARLTQVGFSRRPDCDAKTITLGEVTFWRAFSTRWEVFDGLAETQWERLR